MAADVLQRQFTQIHNAVFRDPRMSFKAKGIFGLISTHVDGYGVSEESITACATDGLSAVRTGLKELIALGYLQRRRERDQRGRLGESEYYITDMPEGLSIILSPGWDVLKEDRRPEPTCENRTLDADGRTPSSEPTCGSPRLDEPTFENRPHKNNTPGGGSSPSGGEEDSLSQNREGAPALDKVGTAGERDTIAALQPSRMTSMAEVHRQREPSEQPAAEERIVDAYAAALARPVLNGTQAKLKRQAAELLAQGLPEGWLCDRARELAWRGWSDLVQHVERSTVPINGHRPMSRPGLPEWCGQCGESTPAARLNPRFRTLGSVGSGQKCPRCHPHVVQTGL
ncbi:hypothetical protein [Streptomyces alanosinicus]|nr:hypothetical protein [Streptomyces alanosinicus]